MAKAEERPDIKIDRGPFPTRFIDLHLLEFASWNMGNPPVREFRLRWPAGSSGPATLRIGFEVLGRGTSSPVIRLKLEDEASVKTLQDYMAAIGRADAEYTARMLNETVAGKPEVMK